MNSVQPSEMVAMYQDGHTVKEVSERYGVSVGKTYYLLKDAGCQFRRKGFVKGQSPAAEIIEKRRHSMIGRKLSDDQKRHISESRKSRFNGLNGYGHTKMHKNGYVLAYAPLHPNAHKDGYVMQHTIIMEQSLGRYLKPDEVAHHINHVRNDNRIENLQLMDKAEHQRMHMRERGRCHLSTV